METFQRRAYKANYTKVRKLYLRKYTHATIAIQMIRLDIQKGILPDYLLSVIDDQELMYRDPIKARNRFKCAHKLHIQVRQRDGNKCVECLSNNNTQIHHIKPIQTHPHLSNDLKNLILLCRMCHRQKH